MTSQDKASYEPTPQWVHFKFSGPPKNIGLFCKIALKKRLYSAKETYIALNVTKATMA